MKRYVCLLLIVQLGNACLKAQEVVDTMYLFCQYKAQTIKLTSGPLGELGVSVDVFL